MTARYGNNISITEQRINESIMHSTPCTIYISKENISINKDYEAVDMLYKLSKLSGLFEATIVEASNNNDKITLEADKQLGQNSLLSLLYQLRLDGYSVNSVSYINYSGNREVISIQSLHTDSDTIKISIDDSLIELASSEFQVGTQEELKYHRAVEVYIDTAQDCTDYITSSFINTYRIKQASKVRLGGVCRYTILSGGLTAVISNNKVLLLKTYKNMNESKFIDDIANRLNQHNIRHTLNKSNEIYMF